MKDTASLDGIRSLAAATLSHDIQPDGDCSMSCDGCDQMHGLKQRFPELCLGLMWDEHLARFVLATAVTLDEMEDRDAAAAIRAAIVRNLGRVP